MKSYKDSSFDDRACQAAKANQEALEKLRSRPPTDPAIAAERQAASQRRAEAQAEKSADKKAAEQASRDGKAAKAAEPAARLASAKPSLTEEERKLARDARHAARKNRK